MILVPNEEQTLLRDMVARFLADHEPAAGPAHAALPVAQWRALGELGVLALAVPEACGGLDGGPVEVALVGEALGRAAAMTPLAEAAILSARLLAGSDVNDETPSVLASLLTGETIVAYAGAGDGQGTVSVKPADGGWSVSGTRTLVRHGDGAAAFIVDTGDLEVRLILVSANAPGLTVRPCRLADGEMAASLIFDDVVVEASSRLSIGDAGHRRALALAQLAVVAEMVGLMQTLFEATVTYIGERRQFGVPIGSFQVIQHKAARLFILIEQSRSMLARAVHADDDDFEHRVLEARAYVSDAALRMAQDTTQMHGGMGVTDELLVGRGHRRLLVLSHLFGGALGAREMLAA